MDSGSHQKFHHSLSLSPEFALEMNLPCMSGLLGLQRCLFLCTDSEEENDPIAPMKHRMVHINGAAWFNNQDYFLSSNMISTHIFLAKSHEPGLKSLHLSQHFYIKSSHKKVSLSSVPDIQWMAFLAQFFFFFFI